MFDDEHPFRRLFKHTNDYATLLTKYLSIYTNHSSKPTT